jgi:SAM-dependent methyltransferase
MVKQLRGGSPIADRDFDEVFPKWARNLSKTHWTPVDVAMRAAAWLTEDPETRVLDVGAGAGKFCLVGALTTGGIFTGVELRPRLTLLATEVARRYGVKRCRFVAGDAFELDWRDYDAFYLFNPFAEQLPGCSFIDDAIPRGPDHFHRYVDAVERRLDELPVGTRIVTYHGFGGRMPFSWAPVTSMRMHAGSLALWRKTAV